MGSMKALVKQHFLLKEPAASERARSPARLEKPNTSPALSLISFKHLPKLSNILRTIALTSTRSSLYLSVFYNVKLYERDTYRL